MNYYHVQDTEIMVRRNGMEKRIFRRGTAEREENLQRSLVKGNGDIVVECCMISENILKNFRGKYRRIQMKGWIMLLQETGLPAIRWHDLRSIYCTLLLKNNFSPKAVAKLMGDARELITMDVYGDNGNIIAEEIPPELLSYMEEVLPEKKKDNIENVLDTLINVEEFHRTNVRFAYTNPYFHDIIALTFEC